MSLISICQRCGDNNQHAWNIKQAEFHVGGLMNWKVQLCPDCTVTVEQALLKALRPPRAVGAVDPVGATQGQEGSTRD
jgi:hypothetical protein